MICTGDDDTKRACTAAECAALLLCDNQNTFHRILLN